jgi:hypothetical protein
VVDLDFGECTTIITRPSGHCLGDGSSLTKRALDRAENEPFFVEYAQLDSYLRDDELST